MSTKEKLKDKFWRVPPPKDFRWGELVTLMGSFGYELVAGKGSHAAFYNRSIDHYIRGIPKPHGDDSHIKTIYIKEIKKKLIELGANQNE